MDGILNEPTRTVHKPETGASGLHTECGASNTVDSVQLREVEVEQVANDLGVSKCGNCFDDGGGY